MKVLTRSGELEEVRLDKITERIQRLSSKIPKLDLHGLSLNESNKIVKKFIIENFNAKYKKLLIVTGKGKTSKFYDNPYVSEKLGLLKYSVPEFIKNNQELSEKINKISKASQEDGGDGAFYVFLKN